MKEKIIATMIAVSPVLIVVFSVLIGGGLLAVTYYQDSVYEADRATYDSEKALFDARQDSIEAFKRDSLYMNWVATNDTTIRSIQKLETKSRNVVTKFYVDSLRTEIMKLDGTEQKRVLQQWYNLRDRLHKKNVKTGRYECSPSDNGKMICEDETQVVWLPETITISWVDTIWSSGYVSRNQWVSQANKYADSLAKKARLVYGPYNGHEFHYILKEDSTLYKVWYLLALITPITFIFGVWMLISCAKEIRDEHDKE